jgi:hypothetical protein
MLCLDFQVLLSMTPKKVRRIKDANMVLRCNTRGRRRDRQIQHKAAELMYLRVLGGKEKALGPDHTSTSKQYFSRLYSMSGSQYIALQALWLLTHAPRA